MWRVVNYLVSPDQLVQCRLTDGVAQHAGEWSDAGNTGDVDDVPLAGGQVGAGGSRQYEGGSAE